MLEGLLLRTLSIRMHLSCRWARSTSGEPLFATPCCNTSRATWSTPSEPLHKKPFFEVLSFSALFGTGCCCQLVYFEFGVLHFRSPLYTRNGQIGEHVLLLWFLTLVLAGCCCQLFECCASFPFAFTRNGQIVEHVGEPL